MSDTNQWGVKYLARHCSFVKREVWAILTKHPDGTWKIVNCLDKDNACFQHDCAFTTDGGGWPFEQDQVRDMTPS